MTPQEQVCTFEQAKILDNLGIKQDSILRWLSPYALNVDGMYANYYIDDQDAEHEEWVKEHGEASLRAYTVAELGEMLTSVFGYRKTIRMPQVRAYDEGLDWWHPYLKDNSNCIQFPTEAQARAALLIHRLEKEKEHDT